MKFKPYSKYKASGVEWLGEVPTDWTVRKLAQVVDAIGSGTTPKSDVSEYYENGEIPWLNTGDLNDAELHSCNKSISKAALESHSSLKIYPAGSVVIAMYGATIGKLAKLHFSTTVNQACCVFSCGDIVHKNFLFYWLLGFREQIVSLATGGGQPNISQEVLRTLRLACPDLSEQSAIAAFLDLETAKIDTLIAKQEKLIDLLKEKRQAVISHAVTKGLDSTVPMKPSGVDWLGDVPEHWVAAPLKRFIKQVPGAIKTGPFGSQLTSAEMQTGSFKVYNQRSVIDADFESGDNYITDQKFHDLRAFEVFAGDILVTTRGTIGRAAVFPDKAEKGILHPCLLRIQVEPTTLIGDFLLTIIQGSHLLKHQIKVLSNSTTIEVIYSETMASVVIPLPPCSEQQAIVKYLRNSTTKIDTLIAKAQQAIALQKEHRNALISAAVTGKIDVRDTAVQIKKAA